MKIWCCLCYGEEEDDKKGTMRGGNFQDESEAKVGDMENDEPERFLLGKSTGSPDESESQMVDANKDLGEREEVGGSNPLSRDFDQFASSSGQGLMEEEIFIPGEIVLVFYYCTLGVNADGEYLFRDWEFHFAAATSSSDTNGYNFHLTDHKTNKCCLNKEIFNLSSLPNAGADQKGLDSVGQRDGGGGCSVSEMQDSVVRMDLTDDLLHMVFSFLKPINLCQAAMVCKQWRAASAHEDFWRGLDFENRNISVQQLVLIFFPPILAHKLRSPSSSFPSTDSNHVFPQCIGVCLERIVV
ncbi:F-box family protein [Actinidia rufa]|uniref:F-box family protein n=1 Tax=Actinidia rufa TaxID=165716 RepID=A0A7J0DCD0_9ERIC|nr:F-box family protein [Actinidia rufa]